MNKDQFQGHWQELKGKIKEKWGKLTDDEISQINGKKEQLLGKLQAKYGYAREKAEEELKSFQSQFSWYNKDEREHASMSNRKGGSDYSKSGSDYTKHH